MQISRSGYNALAETNTDHIQFSSQYNTLKYYLEGSVTVTINNGNSTQTQESTVTHNLGYVPAFVVYVPAFGTSQYNIVPWEIGSFLTTARTFSAFADSTYIYFRVVHQIGSPPSSYTGYSVVFFYKVYRNSLGL